MTSLRYPLEIGRNGSFAVDTSDIAKTRSRIIATLATAIGERVMRPDFGTDLMQSYYLSGEEVIPAVEGAVSDLFAKMSAEGYWAGITLHSVDAVIDPRHGGSTVSVDVQWALGDAVITTSDTINIESLIQESDEA